MSAYQKLDDTQCDILVVARMSPLRNARTRRLVCVLARNHRVRVISENPAGLSGKTAVLDGARLDELGLPFPNVHVWYFTGLLRVLVFNLRAVWVALTSGASAVVCSDSLYYLAGAVLKLILRKKFVYNSHEIMWALGTPPWLSAVLGGLENFAIRICDFWLVPSEERAAIIGNRHRLHKRYLVYENFPILDGAARDPESLSMAFPFKKEHASKPIVMFQGSIAAGRGIEELIQAAESGEFQLVIQGQGRLLERIRRGNLNGVTFLAPCSNRDTVSWLSLADLSFVYYENDCLNSAYACSNKFYNSVFAGVPVLCNRLPVFLNFANRYGGVEFFDNLEAKSIQSCIHRALQPARYVQLKNDITRAKKILEAIPLEEKIERAFREILPEAG